MRALIFCKSESMTVPIEIKKEDFIICADSGAEYAWKCNAVPSLFVGDCDSFSKNTADKFNCEKIYLPQEKDCTDTFFAAEKALEPGRCLCTPRNRTVCPTLQQPAGHRPGFEASTGRCAICRRGQSIRSGRF